MIRYKMHVEDRNYNDITFYNAITMEALLEDDIPDIDPIKNKLINGDIFNIVDGKPVIIHSTIKKTKHISGVLVLQDGKKYGKWKNKYLYKCIPDDKRLPVFVVAYKPQITFKKKLQNRYITFKFLNWKSKHPQGQIVTNIGEVNKLSNFYEYQMYCKSLYASIANMKRKAKAKLQEHTEEWYINKIMTENSDTIKNRLDFENIITIDSKGSRDLDDAIGYKYIANNTVWLSIYISNVTIWFETFNLWQSFTDRVSTIYLPDRKRPMLPTLLSENISSLLEGKKRFVFTLNIVIDTSTNQIVNHFFENSLIQVKKNHHHKTEQLETCPIYNTLKMFAKSLNKKNVYLDNMANSNEIVAYYMVFMNYYSALELKKYESGIFRFSNVNENYEVPENTPSDIGKFLKIWHTMGGKYCKFSNIQEHQALKLESYLHITSPNRRLVDMVNMIQFQEKTGLFRMSDMAKEFYEKWVSDESLKYINESMRSIRKVESDCKLLHKCSTNGTLTKTSINGYVFDKLHRNDELFQYIVYLPSLKMTHRITTTENLKNLSQYNFKIYIFMDEIRLKQKIRLLLVKNN